MLRRYYYKLIATLLFWRASVVHERMVYVYAELTAIQRANEMVGRYVRFDREAKLEAEYALLTTRYNNLMALYAAYSPNTAANIQWKRK